MRRSLAVFAGLSLLLPTMSAAAQQSRSFDLSGFTAIDASGDVEIHIRQGDSYSVTVTYTDDDIEQLELDVRGRTLRARGRREGWFGGKDLDLKIDIVMPRLEEVEVSAGADLFGEDLMLEALDVSVSSGADVELSGQCTRLDAETSSGADLRARDLRCTAVEVEVSSGSDAWVYAIEEVDATASSGADVHVYGIAARIRSDSNSGGDIHLKLDRKS